ncbi:response regulator [Oceanihabitans sp. IOP_32]|uniref:response regulator n=1 Tax=Oceanihabitans sp. IOP_32 TaxID=2529032 RepID=UPI001293BD61|nr:response regulator [Oceanihabitans sp. IOP_32]QFZ55423.1 response regulator [Oceanihabitans sp. IOP_32]
MRKILLLSFLFVNIFSFAQNDREVIKKIDDLNASALILYNDKQIVEAFKVFNKAKALADSIEDDYGAATANFSLGNIYYLMQNYESAKVHYDLTLDALKGINDYYLISAAYLNLAKIFKEQNNYDVSVRYLKKALQNSIVGSGMSVIDKQNVQNIYFESGINLCELYIENNKLDEALIKLLEYGNYLKVNAIKPKLESYYNFVYGMYFTKKAFYNTAREKFGEAILLLEQNNKETDLDLMSNIYMQLSISFAKSGKNEAAYTALLEHINYQNKFYKEDKDARDLIIKSQFLIEDYKNEAETANYQRLQQLEIANKFKKINIVIFISLLLLVISLLVIYKGAYSKIKLSDTLKQKNLELEIAKDNALKASELKTKFISNVSHELRTPLYGVVGISTLLLNEKKDLSERDTKYLESLKYSGDYLLNLVNDILQMNKIEAQKIELKNVSVNLKALAQSITDSFGYKLQESGNQIKIAIDEGVPEFVKVDKVRISQVLINLIANSIKFTQSGVINLRIKLLKLGDKKVTLRFEVEDDGIGVPKDKFKTIFNNFSQLGNETNTSYQGTGLGLSITKSIVQLLGSKIELESEVGQGAKFSFNVELEIDKKKKSILDANRFKKIDGDTDSKFNILIAEDNKINQIVTKNLLIGQNYSCEVVNNGAEAVEKVKLNNYDLILMDINMPKMNGYDATAAIREFDKEIPIIALTAADVEEVMHNFKTIGFNDIITKPFDNYEFFQTIAFHIEITNYRRGKAGFL